MIRKHENPDSFKAGFYALAVHAVLLVAMLVSFNWKAAHPVMNVTEVELWDKLPAPRNIETPEPEPEPKPIIKEEPKPEPKPIVKEEPKPEPKPEEPKIDIELEKKKKELEVKRERELEEKLLQEKKLKALQAQTREEALKDKTAAEKAQKDALKKAQQEFLAEEKGSEDKAASATNASLMGEYIAKIRAKVTGNVNKTLCGDGNPEVIFAVSVLPTGQLSGNPKLVKSSGNTACDEAAERAIIASEPLPLPSDPALFSQFRNINLKFRPND